MGAPRSHETSSEVDSPSRMTTESCAAEESVCEKWIDSSVGVWWSPSCPSSTRVSVPRSQDPECVEHTWTTTWETSPWATLGTEPAIFTSRSDTVGKGVVPALEGLCELTTILRNTVSSGRSAVPRDLLGLSLTSIFFALVTPALPFSKPKTTPGYASILSSA